jgi:hypothetical protein
MVVDNFNLVRMPVPPDKADAPLIIYPHTMLAGSVTP